MNDNKIDEMYDNLLKTADSIVENGVTEETEKDFEKLKEEIKDTDSITVIPEEDQKVSDTTGEVVMTTYNPETGEQTADPNENSANNITEQHFQAFLDNGKFDKTSLENILKSKELSNLKDITQIATIIQKRMKGESFDYYAELPASMKTEVVKLMMNMGPMNAINRNYVAKKFIDNLVEEYEDETSKKMEMDLDTMLANFDKDINNLQAEFANDMGGIMMDFDEDRKSKIDAAIKKCEEENDQDAINRLKKIRETLDDAYNLNKFAEFCLHCKIKNYDMRDPKHIFDDFNFKYENHKNTINDIRSCPKILDRHMTDLKSEYKLMLCIAFCKYCLNMSPDNIEEHTFMYYFIRNIILIDRINPKGKGYETMNEQSKKFYDEFTNNLKKCIFNILERNPTLK